MWPNRKIIKINISLKLFKKFKIKSNNYNAI